MIRVTVEFVPRGDDARARTLDVLEIVNDCTGDETFGHYDVRSRGDDARVRIDGFERARGRLSLVREAMAKLASARAA